MYYLIYYNCQLSTNILGNIHFHNITKLIWWYDNVNNDSYQSLHKGFREISLKPN